MDFWTDFQKFKHLYVDKMDYHYLQSVFLNPQKKSDSLLNYMRKYPTLKFTHFGGLDNLWKQLFPFPLVPLSALSLMFTIKSIPDKNKILRTRLQAIHRPALTFTYYYLPPGHLHNWLYLQGERQLWIISGSVGCSGSRCAQNLGSRLQREPL